VAKEKSIIFSTERVRAILEGKMTQTRRVIKPQPVSPFVAHLCPYQPGDILWVQEAWRLVDFAYVDGEWSASVEFKDGTIGTRLFFGEEGANQKTGWRPSIYMPREAARLFLLVKDVRVERLQDITEEDAVKEGCIPLLDKDGVTFISAKGRFHALWDSIS